MKGVVADVRFRVHDALRRYASNILLPPADKVVPFPYHMQNLREAAKRFARTRKAMASSELHKKLADRPLEMGNLNLKLPDRVTLKRARNSR